MPGAELWKKLNTSSPYSVEITEALIRAFMSHPGTTFSSSSSSSSSSSDSSSSGGANMAANRYERGASPRTTRPVREPTDAEHEHIRAQNEAAEELAQNNIEALFAQLDFEEEMKKKTGEKSKRKKKLKMHKSVNDEEQKNIVEAKVEGKQKPGKSEPKRHKSVKGKTPQAAVSDNKEVPRQPCRNFAKGACGLGALCRFAHVDEGLPAPDVSAAVSTIVSVEKAPMTQEKQKYLEQLPYAIMSDEDKDKLDKQWTEHPTTEREEVLIRRGWEQRQDLLLASCRELDQVNERHRHVLAPLESEGLILRREAKTLKEVHLRTQEEAGQAKKEEAEREDLRKIETQQARERFEAELRAAATFPTVSAPLTSVCIRTRESIHAYTRAAHERMCVGVNGCATVE
jgi:hypothetical protein